MESKPNSVTVDIKQKVELFLSYWKWIILSIIVAVLLGYTYLRYTTYEYKANATIKIRDEKQATKLPGIEDIGTDGLFSQGTDKIKDEIKVIQSRTIAENIIKTLDLNIRCFAEGKIKEKELYTNPPIKVSFFESDSVINTLSKNLYLKIKSSTEFIMFKDDGKSLLDRDDREGKVYAFGDKIDTNYGGFVLVPNVGSNAPNIGSNYKIKIRPVTSLVNEYQTKVKISTEKGSSVIKLELKETVAQKAVDYLDQLIVEYNKDVLSDKEEVIKVTSDFINNRLKKVSIELEEVDYTAEQLQKKNNLTALSSQDNINLQSGQQLQTQISTTSNNIQLASFLQDELNSEDRTSDMLPADIGIGDSNTSQVIKTHNELVAQRDRILRNSTEKNPVVIQLNNQIATVKQNLQSSLISIKETSQLTLNNLNRENARIRGQLYQAPTKARQFRDIKRQQDIKESLYLYLLQKREESAISLGMYSPNAKIIDNAYSSYRPVAPNKTITYLASFIVGLLLPIGFIYLIDLLDTKIYGRDDLVKILNIPYLGDIPKSSKKTRLINKVDYSPKAEAFRIVRSNIDFMLKDVKGRSKKLFVTSTKAQEGKSHTSTNLASSISFSEKAVLLIEMDIRVPKILDYLGIKEKPEKGLSDYIADKSIKPQDVVVKHPENTFLDIIPSGTIPPNPSELLMSDRVEELFNYFENKYDYIVADTSAVGLVSDTLLISKFADMFVYVVSADGVDKRQLTHVAQTLYDEKRLPNMTMLLNSVRTGKKGYGYGYGYGNNPNNKKKWYNFFS
ncbi:polysaccharide biosynthesis tyrosine autokinase [Winogradskyella sp.]|uniref:GumC family protein n=1 Tax=Winogradskyella sp. TaxID=1883156 RepID=UPI0025F81652|nr:polysaccharide biosynthesis tyrosine autokinase [Winogradskyella sp.]